MGVSVAVHESCPPRGSFRWDIKEWTQMCPFCVRPRKGRRRQGVSRRVLPEGEPAVDLTVEPKENNVQGQLPQGAPPVTGKRRGLLAKVTKPVPNGYRVRWTKELSPSWLASASRLTVSVFPCKRNSGKRVCNRSAKVITRNVWRRLATVSSSISASSSTRGKEQER